MTASPTPRRTLAQRLGATLQHHWWQARPSGLAQLLRPLSWSYAALARALRRAPTSRVAVPTLVVGNLIVGGAGKTPTVIALAQAFAARGRRPGVISRGHGRSSDGVQAVMADSRPGDVGDEPLLIRRRAGVPVWVGRDRSAVARALCLAHPDIDVLIADDGLQHRALARDGELLVFDDRGAGNGLLLPAGPLREALPAAAAAHQRVLYSGTRISTPLPGAVGTRTLTRALPLRAWLAGDERAAQPLAALQNRSWLAVAGLASPQRFFDMLRAAGLHIDTLALPDHHDYAELPWPLDTPQVLTTEKDAVKLRPDALGATAVWVVPLDFALPPGLADDLLALLPLPSSVPAGTPTP